MALWLLNIVAYIINFVVVNWGVELFGGKTIAELSDEYRTQVTPAGWAFSIWGVIYFFELIFVVWGALEGNRSRPVINQGVGYFFISACLFQAAWEITFTHEYILASAVLICGIAISLALAVVGLAPFKRDTKVLLCSVPFWTVHFPIGLHGGWTLAASLVNINILFKSDSVSSGTAAVILTVVAASVGASIAAIRFQDQVYLLAIAWAVFAIAARGDYRVKTLGQGEADGMALALNVLCIALLCIGAVTAILDQRQRMIEKKNALEAQKNDGYLLESYYMIQSDNDTSSGNIGTARATLLP